MMSSRLPDIWEDKGAEKGTALLQAVQKVSEEVGNIPKAELA